MVLSAIETLAQKKSSSSQVCAFGKMKSGY